MVSISLQERLRWKSIVLKKEDKARKTASDILDTMSATSPAETIATVCVSYVISEDLSNFGSFFPKQDVNNGIVQQYGYQCVAGNVLYDVLDNYLIGNQNASPTAYDALSSANQMVATVRLGSNIGHAVIILNIDDDNVMVRDPQKADLEPLPTNPHSWYLYSKSEIVHLYEASASN